MTESRDHLAASRGNTEWLDLLRPLRARQDRLRVATLSTLALFAGAVLLDQGALFVLLGPLVGLAIARWAAGRLNGGLTGDVYGALCEVTELFALLGLALAG